MILLYRSLPKPNKHLGWGEQIIPGSKLLLLELIMSSGDNICEPHRSHDSSHQNTQSTCSDSVSCICLQAAFAERQLPFSPYTDTHWEPDSGPFFHGNGATWWRAATHAGFSLEAITHLSGMHHCWADVIKGHWVHILTFASVTAERRPFRRGLESHIMLNDTFDHLIVNRHI